MIPIGKIGRILEGQDADWYVFVVDDTAQTGGSYILIGDAPNFIEPQFAGKIYDCWVEYKEDLEPFFQDRKVQGDLLVVD